MQRATASPTLVDAAEIARLLGISSRSVHRLAERGEIPHVRAGNKRRFDADEVLAALRIERTA